MAQGHTSDWMKTIDSELLELKQEVAGSSAQLKNLKQAGKDASDALAQQKGSTRRALDDWERRHEAIAKAAAVFSEALHIPNPLASSMAAAAV